MAPARNTKRRTRPLGQEWCRARYSQEGGSARNGSKWFRSLQPRHCSIPDVMPATVPRRRHSRALVCYLYSPSKTRRRHLQSSRKSGEESCGRKPLFVACHYAPGAKKESTKFFRELTPRSPTTGALTQRVQRSRLFQSEQHIVQLASVNMRRDKLKGVQTWKDWHWLRSRFCC